jgi:hypothetical protein
MATFRISFAITNDVELELDGDVIARALEVRVDGLTDEQVIEAIVSSVEEATEETFRTLMDAHQQEWEESESYEVTEVEHVGR